MIAFHSKVWICKNRSVFFEVWLTQATTVFQAELTTSCVSTSSLKRGSWNELDFLRSHVKHSLSIWARLSLLVYRGETHLHMYIHICIHTYIYICICLYICVHVIQHTRGRIKSLKMKSVFLMIPIVSWRMCVHSWTNNLINSNRSYHPIFNYFLF